MTKFHDVTMLTFHAMDGQMHATGKAVKPLFADLVKFINTLN